MPRHRSWAACWCTSRWKTFRQLAQQMRNIYAEMPHECVTSMGMMKRVPFTLSVAVAGLDELDSAANCWQRLYAICDERLRGIQISGGNKIC